MSPRCELIEIVAEEDKLCGGVGVASFDGTIVCAQHRDVIRADNDPECWGVERALAEENSN